MSIKLEKALELLEEHDTLNLVFKNPDLHASVKLGMEALKRIQLCRLHPGLLMYKPLPGESMPEREFLHTPPP